MTTTRVPAESLYLAMLDPPLARGRARKEELGYAFEACLPVDIDGVHAVYRPLVDGRVLAVGIDRKLVEELGHEHASATIAAWPEWLDASVRTLDPESVNLLTGAATPGPVRRMRTGAVVHTVLVLSLLGLIAVWGMQRRIASAATEFASIREQQAVVYDRALGLALRTSAQPAPALMTAELRRLRATRTLPRDDPGQSEPADLVLAHLLEAWPTDTTARAESITIAERSVEVVVRLPDLAAVQGLVTSLSGVDGLEIGPTSTETDQGEVRLRASLRREATP